MKRTIEVSEETYEAIKDQLQDSADPPEDLVGGKWFIRTVTYHCIGRAVKQTGDLLWLENASWIPDSVRFMQTIREGALKEVEPVGLMAVNIKAIVDLFPWTHPLPTNQMP